MTGARPTTRTEGLGAGREVAGSARAASGRAAGPLAWLPAGTAFGTLVHAVLEDVDFAATDLAASLAAGIDRQLARRAVDLAPPQGLGPDPGTRGRDRGQRACPAGRRASGPPLESPLGPLCGGLAPGRRRPRRPAQRDVLRAASGPGGPRRPRCGRWRLVLAHLDDGRPTARLGRPVWPAGRSTWTCPAT